MKPINDMADLPVQHPEAPATAAEARGRYFNSGNAFNIKLPPVPPRIFTEEATRALAAEATGIIDCDQSAALGSEVAATTPFMLARYAVAKAGDTLELTLKTSASIWYVIKGAGELYCGEATVVVGAGDVLLLPGSVAAGLTATSDCVLWGVGNDPLMAFEGLTADLDAPAAAFVHYPAKEIARQLDLVYASDANTSTSGHALIFSAETTEHCRNISPMLTLSLNTLRPHAVQPPHRHNSAAITLAVAGDPAYTTVDGEKCHWSQWATLVTPPTAAHGHHNEGETRAEFLIVQDGGLYYRGRTMGLVNL
ncbi:hypothetical protein DLJ53_12605 [Acuticoccus sediminis]|uniref:Cupin domain-containing protein n=1 Tax=Acuticoccus sediminis TaxID=2184697 RepID=A0A8B2P070_9HYPH|nr:cupin domain-containing protein [Acuticoccus sediminis]RAI02200.1 hypothetical protein DLJ53_12605 [Acuticoccus sediminis]